MLKCFVGAQHVNYKCRVMMILDVLSDGDKKERRSKIVTRAHTFNNGIHGFFVSQNRKSPLRLYRGTYLVFYTDNRAHTSGQS